MVVTKEISMGVDNFCFTLKSPCVKDTRKAINICLSFKVSGNFLGAALSDQLSDTMDYAELCHHIEKSLLVMNCKDHEGLRERIQSAIINFSPLITGGYYSLTVQCHNTFTIERHLI